MSDTPQQATLDELTRDIPHDLRAEWPIQWSEDGCPTGHTMAPIGKYIHELRERVSELERQLAEAQKDAERYRWLRSAGWLDDAIMEREHINELYPETMDAAIDAAKEGE